MAKSAWGDSEKFTGDLHSHMMAINPSQIDQFTIAKAEDGTERQAVLAQIGLNFACRRCHGAGLGMPRTDEELTQAATGYHDQPKPEPEPTATSTP